MATDNDASLDGAVRAAWERNLAVNRALVRHLEPAMLTACSPGGGPSVAQHLAHMVATVKFWGNRIDPDRMATLPDLFFGEPESGEPGGLDTESDLARIEAIWLRTGEAALAAARSHPAGASESPHADAAACLVHMLVRDAHHRGQILLALKVAGHALPSGEAMWGPWRS